MIENVAFALVFHLHMTPLVIIFTLQAGLEQNLILRGSTYYETERDRQFPQADSFPYHVRILMSLIFLYFTCVVDRSWTFYLSQASKVCQTGLPYSVM